MIPYRVCYSIVTPESAAEGDFAETGVETEGTADCLRDLIRLAERYGIGSRSRGDSTGWLSSEPDPDYRSGEETTYTLHVDPRVLPRLERFLR